MLIPTYAGSHARLLPAKASSPAVGLAAVPANPGLEALAALLLS